MKEKGWNICAPYTTGTHIKTFTFDDEGYEPSVNIAKFMHILLDSGYDGYWGVESMPMDGDEYDGTRRTIELIKKIINE